MKQVPAKLVTLLLLKTKDPLISHWIRTVTDNEDMEEYQMKLDPLEVLDDTSLAHTLSSSRLTNL